MTEPIAIASRKTRADGQRNRSLILDAAKRVLTEKGVGASMDEIAQRAGVGNGTLYRHFPTRAALVEAVCREDARELIDAATQLAATHPPIDALTAWMDVFVDCISTKQIIAEATNALLSASLKNEDTACADAGEALIMLFERAVAEGQLRGDFDPLDIVRAVTGLATISPHAGWENNAKSLVRVIIAGLTSTSVDA